MIGGAIFRVFIALFTLVGFGCVWGPDGKEPRNLLHGARLRFGIAADMLTGRGEAGFSLSGADRE